MNTSLLRFAVVLFAAVPALMAGTPACCHAPLTADAPLPAASLYQTEVAFTTDSDTPLRLAELRGQPVALVMFFASCTHACPATVVDLVRIREKVPAALREKTRIVMVTFDVERDTPAALRAFRESRGIPADWVLLHGSNDAVRELAALLGVKYKREADGMFAHSNLVTILSRDGEITHQRAGLTGGLDEAAAALAAAAAVGDGARS
ncbi:MAG: SCO family protein [Opitutaceae bacterium]|nr:SCO family protein [Opitutaceae bacterium]